MAKAARQPTRSRRSSVSPRIVELSSEIEKATASLPVCQGEPGDEIRPFPIYEEVPPGHALFRVMHDHHEPYLRKGEFVVVDTNDREVAFGELHLMLQSNGPILWQIKQERGGIRFSGDDRPPVLLCPLTHDRYLPDGRRDEWRPINMSDVCTIDDAKANLLGRVVGILDPEERVRRRYREAIHARLERERAEKARRMAASGGRAG